MVLIKYYGNIYTLDYTTFSSFYFDDDIWKKAKIRGLPVAGKNRICWMCEQFENVLEKAKANPNRLYTSADCGYKSNIEIIFEEKDNVNDMLLGNKMLPCKITDFIIGELVKSELLLTYLKCFSE